MKKISPYLGLYRAMMIVTIIVALVYATFNFFQYQEAVRELVIDNRPSVQIEREYQARLQIFESIEADSTTTDDTTTPDSKSTEKPTREIVAQELFGLSTEISPADFDQIWLYRLYAMIGGGSITFLFALATIVSALFALNTKRLAAFSTPAWLFSVFITNQITIFLVNGYFGIYEYNQYFFNFLELIFILALIGLTLFTIFAHPNLRPVKK